MDFKTPYGPRKRHMQHIGEGTIVQRSAKAECDVNNIMEKYIRTGLLEHVNRHQGNYGDYTNAPTYHEAFNKLQEAHTMFQSLPAKVRDKFANDPGLFLEYVSDDKNADGMRELGLLPPKPATTQSEEASLREATPPGEGGGKPSSGGAAQAKRGSEQSDPPQGG